jgi:predicted glycoside hydrolase/deacetylase ChbG (UPF0249 family)
MALCLCADDFGLNEGVNQAVARLVALGRLHATGALVGAPAWPLGRGWLRRAREGALDVGLHLDFTEHPLTTAPQALRALILRCHLGRVDRVAVRTEIRAQLDTFEDGMGRGPDFVDGHQHVHQLPTIRDLLVEELARRYPPGGAHHLWVRQTRPSQEALAVASTPDAFKARTIGALGASALAAAVHRQGWRQNRSLLGVYGFTGGQPRYQQRLDGWLLAARTGDLLMCHPGHAGGRDAIAPAREAEFQLLGGHAFGQRVRALGLVLRPMSDILADRG